ncbi:hypothetical protein [Yinghuangia seranimata]|uniref:F0F1 ATP synthase subunit B family protein n=1 Tax=Yinghuangia seranimata TaxID=408067 RepID=UPI00248A9BF3|nr:hypothetical protein [Yinghuangia seranimata]MDI2130208.1 hypothetical protein [Yinghuangia seranimata]
MGPLEPKGGDLIVAIFAWAVILIVVAGILVPRIQRVIEQREDAIEGGTDRADSTREESARVAQEIATELGEARREAARIRAEANAEGAEAIEEARSEGQRIRTEIVASGHASIANERDLAEEALTPQVGLIATDLAAKVLGESVAEFVAERDTVAAFLAERN